MGLRRLLTNVTLSFASLGLALLALEGLARFARSHGHGKEAGTIALYTEHEPLLGWRKRPGGRATFHRHEYTVEVVINGHGLRDKERDYPAPPGSFRILALGDSFIEGYSVPLEQTMTQVLEFSLQRPTCPIEVINGGTAAYSTDQEYLFYKTEGVRYSPQVVLLFFYFNDIVYNASDRYFGTPKPVLAPGDGDIVVKNAPVPSPPPALAPLATAEEPSGSALLEWVRDRLMRGTPRAYDRLALLGLWPPIPVTAPPDHYKVFRRRSSPEVAEGWQQTRHILEALMREVAIRGARLLVVYVPSRMEVSDRDWELTKIRYGLDESLWDRGKVIERLRLVAERRGFPVVDLTMALRAADRGLLGGPYYVRDGHWNAVGHRVAAREVERYLREQGWLPSCLGPSAQGPLPRNGRDP